MTTELKYVINLGDWTLLKGNDPDTAIISQYKGNDEIVEIPSVIDGKTIVGIAGFAFCGENTKNIKKIIVPNTVQVIYEENVFGGCENLEEIIMPDSVIKIGNNNFSGCAKLKEINIPGSVKKIPRIGSNVLEKVILNDGTERICSWAFSNAKLKSVVIPNTVKKIDDLAFLDNEELKDVVLSEKVTKLEDMTFLRCKKINYLEALKLKDVAAIPKNKNMVLVLPAVSFEEVEDDKMKLNLVMGYLHSFEKYKAKVAEIYLKYIAENLDKVLPAAKKNGLVEGIELLKEKGLVSI